MVMRFRSLTVLTAFAVLVAACSPSDSTETTTTSGSDVQTTTTAPGIEAPDAVVLSYSLQSGQSYTYEVSIDQHMTLESTGDPTALGDEEIPGEMELDVQGTSVFTYSVTDGPEPGTFSIHITGDFSDLTFSGTMDGEPVDQGEIPDLAEMEPVDATILVDEMGNIIPEDTEFGEDFLFGGLDLLEQMGPGAGLGQFVGPPFNGEEVTVGDTWSDTVEVPGMDEDSTITTEVVSEVTGTSEIEGHEVFVIETTTTTSAFEFDLGELLFGFMFAFAPDDLSDEEQAELDEMMEQLRFAFGVDETVANMTTWFDPESGFARQAELSSATGILFDINMPDDETDELIAFGMNMSIDQNVSYTLTESSGA